MIGRILIPLFDDPLEYRLLDAAANFTDSRPACLQVAYFRPEPIEETIYGSEVVTTGLMVEALEERAQVVRRNITVRLKDWSSQHHYEYVHHHTGTAPCQVSLAECTGDPIRNLKHIGRLSDLIICLLPTDEQRSFEPILEVSVSQTGRPVLALPKAPPADLTKHILLAWDGSIEVSRLLALTLPIFAKAERVSIFCYPEKDCDAGNLHRLIEYFRCHGISAEPCNVRSAKPVGESLIEAALISDATLIAMGAYSHSRIRQQVFGGLTRHMIEYGKFPLLLAH
ncbi:MAG: universal stress protein [Rhodospirillaceae bacterium]|nr:MAG: universal stress protein [Rhodospirillaceae bacterium]